MPELPEVETVRAGLERHVVGRTVATAEVLNPRAVRRDPSGPDGFAAAMADRTFLRAERRGKYLWFALWDARPMAKTAIVSGAHPRDISRGDDPPYPPRGETARVSGARPSHISRGDDPPYPPRGKTAGVSGAQSGYVSQGDDVPTEALLAHLGMSGQLLVGDPERPLSPHVRARFTFTDGGPDLRFTDQRTFGHLMLVELSPGGTALGTPSPVDAGGPGPANDGDVGPDSTVKGSAPVTGGRLVPVPIVHIAPDPLEDAFDPKDFTARLIRKKTQVKRALLDQSLISGIGNIYADEALWRAKLHWARPTDTLKRTEVARLLEGVRDVLTEALKAGGTSFDALYVNVNGESGYFDRSLNAYGREGEPCGRCAAPIRRESFMNRSSYSCPRCQR
ncbi:MAG TPA: Fpg/Nei family DNA glycosylase [Trebonia sp.]